MISPVATPVYTPTSSENFIPSYSPAFIVICFMDNSHSDRGERETQSTLPFPDVQKDGECFLIC